MFSKFMKKKRQLKDMVKNMKIVPNYYNLNLKHTNNNVMI